MAFLERIGLTGDDAARALMLCGAPIDAASAAMCLAEQQLKQPNPTVIFHGPARNVDGTPSVPREPRPASVTTGTRPQSQTNDPEITSHLPPPPPHPGPSGPGDTAPDDRVSQRAGGVSRPRPP